MIVIGRTAQASHTCSAVREHSSRDRLADCGGAGIRSWELLEWPEAGSAAGVAIEDCRHSAAALTVLLARGERSFVSRRADGRRAQRSTGAGSPTDRCARDRTRRIAEASTRFPSRSWMSAHSRSALRPPRAARASAHRADQRLRWHLHDLNPITWCPRRLCSQICSRRRTLARATAARRAVRIARDELNRVRELTRTIDSLHRELGELVDTTVPLCSSSPAAAPSPPPN